MQRQTKSSSNTFAINIQNIEPPVTLQRRLFNEIMYGGHFIALDTSAIVFITSLMLGFMPTIDLLVAAYLFSFASYTLNRARESDMDIISNPERTKYIIGRAGYINIVILFCYIVSLLIALNRSLIFFTALLAPLLLSYLYNIGSKKFVPVMGSSNLKEQFLVKNLAVSVGWGLIAFLTLVYYGGSVNATVFAIFTFIFLRSFIITVFCDIRDVESDSSVGIRTVPIRIGVHRTKLFLLGVNTFSGIFVLFATLSGLLPPMAHFINLLTIYGYYYLLRSMRSDANMTYLCDFVADGEDFVLVPLVILGMVIF